MSSSAFSAVSANVSISTNSQAPSAIEESLGAKATRIAQNNSTHWLDDTWPVIQKTVLDTSARGLFHCTLRFVDVVPQDPENQARLLKILAKQNLRGVFKQVERDPMSDQEAAVDLTISWSTDLL